VSSGPETVLTRYYGGVYFSYAHAALLDGLALASRRLGGEERDVALAAVLSTASDLVSSVGSHFAQPVRPKTADGRLKRAALALRALTPDSPVVLIGIPQVRASGFAAPLRS
jgi:hypothetical protein